MDQQDTIDIPTFRYAKNCDVQVLERTRDLLHQDYKKNPECYYREDIEKLMTDDWALTRFLLRRRECPHETVKLIRECGKFRRLHRMPELKLSEFPIEFFHCAGVFRYLPDRIGNETLYFRVSCHLARQVPEIANITKSFLLCLLEQCDRKNNGRGTCIVFDLTNATLANLDLHYLSWMLTSFRQCCPKGVSYILVYNMPWYFQAATKITNSMMSAGNRRKLKFVNGTEIQQYIAPENLPDMYGGTGKLDYRRVPDGVSQRVDAGQFFKNHGVSDKHIALIGEAASRLLASA
ncbi:Motile sperm domain-containing protein 2 [Fragariocoptes setiger]|uniref:Motile sperm domain-containing protein 2 n=1 Tax=Fragariocoptes setiger TaxID=1670756 RepID=A0ABQ7S5M6_9ACAR|nr:Motile sperm domain-containing protein 2 [Fragariocoptes setiger]